ncbi:MAG TPA: endonuclease/exonuclease/phosphatase family protein [Thermoanaerobaculia bacterium]|nr:endonuclease/exonuclease/phosphatase family protein [Thermoanaerobaculia bacterium]
MRFVRKAVLVVAVIAVIFMAYRFLAIYEWRGGECRASHPATFHNSYPKRLVVMTYNIEGHAALLRSDHIERIAATIAKYHPDVVGLNEAHRNTWQSRFHDNVDQLRRLTHMNGAFGASYEFMNGAFGNAVLTRGTIRSADVHKLPGTGEPRSLFDTVIDIDGGTIEMSVTHTTAWGSVNRETRETQLKCIEQHIRASAWPHILTGDLNAPPDAPEIAAFLASNPLQLANQGQPTHKVTEKQLDYILADRGWRVASARVLDDGPSDHRPVLVELVHQ